jgi:lipopolysaccharide/colanic/teichoic acid biosynthesis glycosyltransferase
VPGYRSRFVVRPGISGFAQVRLGYAEGFALTARKTRLDLLYIRKAGWWLEMRILWRTLVVMATGYGAR